jgi:hypothetical protein
MTLKACTCPVQGLYWACRGPVYSSVRVPHSFTSFQLVDRTAIRTLGLTCLGHIQVDLGMAVPKFHVGFVARTKHTAMTIEVFRQEFNWVTHL